MHYPSAKVKGLVDYFLKGQEQQFNRSDWRFDNLSASYDQSAILLTLRVKSAQVVEWSVSTIARSPFRDFLYSHLNFFFNWFLLTFITILTPSIFFLWSGKRWNKLPHQRVKPTQTTIQNHLQRQIVSRKCYLSFLISKLNNGQMIT